MIEFAALCQELRLPPFILVVPSRCPLIKVNNPTQRTARVDFTAVQDLGMVEQNVTGFNFCWHCIFTFKIGFPSINNLLCLFNAPEVTLWDYPDTSVINGGVIYVYVNVEDRVILTDCISVPMPPHRGTVFGKFENKRFIARNKIGSDYPMEQIPDGRVS